MIFIMVNILMNFLNNFPFQENLGIAKEKEHKVSGLQEEKSLLILTFHDLQLFAVVG